MADREEYVVAKTQNGEIVVVSSSLAQFNGYEVIQGGFGSREEAQAALAPQSPVDQEVYQIEQNNARANSDTRKMAKTASGALNSPGMQELQRIAFNQNAAPTTTPSASAALMDQGRSRDVVERGLRPDRVYTPESGWSMNPGIADDPRSAGMGSPVDMYTGQDVLAGTWAENTDPSQFNAIISGNYRNNPDAAALLMAQGQPTGYLDQATRNQMSDFYANYGNLSAMQSGGMPVSDPLAYHAQAGDYATGWLNFDREEGNLNYGGMWDNQFTPGYLQYADDMTASASDPREEQKNLIIGNIVSLAPNMGPEMTEILASRVEQEYTRYIASGSTGSFTQWLRDAGADTWL
jgi:hypothetical protein